MHNPTFQSFYRAAFAIAAGSPVFPITPFAILVSLVMQIAEIGLCWIDVGLITANEEASEIDAANLNAAVAIEDFAL
jgi:hypothetical protein